MSMYIDLLKSTRAEIVNLLKRQGTMSVETLATELEISKVAVRRHLDQLEDQGFIGHSSERCERGRPKFVYSLTNEGDGLFPDRSADFACDLLLQIGRRHGPEAVDALLVDQADATIESLRRDVYGLDFDGRVEAVVKQFNERGYVADVERLADGSYRIVEHNCPIRDVAEHHPQVCREELRVYSEVTGGTVVKTCCMIANEARSCEYRIVPTETSRGMLGGRSLPIAVDASVGATVTVRGALPRCGVEMEFNASNMQEPERQPPASSSETGSDDLSNGNDSSQGASRKHCMSVCVNVHCSMNGADELVEHLVSEYGVAPDVPVESGLSLELTYCFGACDLGPNVEIDGEFTDGVTIDRLDELLAKLNLRGGVS